MQHRSQDLPSQRACHPCTALELARLCCALQALHHALSSGNYHMASTPAVVRLSSTRSSSSSCPPNQPSAMDALCTAQVFSARLQPSMACTVTSQWLAGRAWLLMRLWRAPTAPPSPNPIRARKFDVDALTTQLRIAVIIGADSHPRDAGCLIRGQEDAASRRKRR